MSGVSKSGVPKSGVPKSGVSNSVDTQNGSFIGSQDNRLAPPLKLSALAKALESKLVQASNQKLGPVSLLAPDPSPDPELSGVNEDSRKVAIGDLFAAVPGARADGRNFAQDAVKNGAAAVLWPLEADLARDGSRLGRSIGVEDGGQEKASDQASVQAGVQASGKTRSQAWREIWREASPEALPKLLGVPVLLAPLEDFRAFASLAAREVYGRPDEKLKVIGLTGTNGKSTISYLLEAILEKAGHTPGVMGTVNYRWPGKVLEAPNTTPEGPLLHRTLASMVKDGVTHAVLEISSHALGLGRVRDLRVEAALFTNLTRDHLDYHASMEDYFQAKRRLFFENLVPSGQAVVCQDGSYGLRLIEELKKERQEGLQASSPGKLLGDSKDSAEAPGSSNASLSRSFRVTGYGLGKTLSEHLGLDAETSPAIDAAPDVAARDLSLNRDGARLAVITPEGESIVRSPLIGAFNVQNVLGAAAMAWALGVGPDAVASGLAESHGAPGRLQKVGGEYLALIDYAHTPSALAAALRSLRALGPRKLLVVFGCGGDRDKGKRPLMGMEAGKLSDLAILTSDNPRTEDPMAIIEDAAKGLRELNLSETKAGNLNGAADAAALSGSFIVEPDRRRAIRLAARLMDKSDLTLIAGKGHEDYQIVGLSKNRFDDAEEALAAFEAAGKGPAK